MLKSALLQMVNVFSKSVLMHGQDYHMQGHVLTLRLSDGLLRARVKGSKGHIYDVYLDFKTWPKIPSRCTCQEVNCKHAVACLIALHEKESLGILPVISTTERVASSTSPPEVIDAETLEWYSESDSQGNAFFSYQLGILIDGQSVSIVPWILEFIKRFDLSSLDVLPDDRVLALPIGLNKTLEITLSRIKPLIRLLLQYGFRKGKKNQDDVLLTRYQLLFMGEAEYGISPLSKHWKGTAALRDTLQSLLNRNTTPEFAPPIGLKAVLRDYQHQGLVWLQNLRVSGFGGVLADDMGLGKTIQTLAHFQHEKEAGRLKKASLIITPTSVLGNWFEEAKRFTPELRVLVYHGWDRHGIAFEDYDLIVSTYGLVQRDEDFFMDYAFYYLVLDEAQFIKNARTKTRQIIQQLKGEHRLCLTGTPLENHLGELWSLFHFLSPGLLGDLKQFRRFFQNPIEKKADVECRQALARRIEPFLLRRAKNEVVRELPSKTEITQMIELVGNQRDVYEAIRISTEREVREAIARQGLGRSHVVLLDALLKLRQVCCDPRLLKSRDLNLPNAESAKLEACLALLDNLMDEGRSVLVFSQFTSMLALIEQALIERQYAYLKLTGQTANRQALVNRFQAGEVPIFLISLKAGGTGLNLTQADTVIHYDPWWNPAVEDQATDRSHRIGQKKPVFVYKLIVSGSVEEAMVGMQNKKRALFEGILTDDAQLGRVALTEADIAEFFMPLE